MRNFQKKTKNPKPSQTAGLIPVAIIWGGIGECKHFLLCPVQLVVYLLFRLCASNLVFEAVLGMYFGAA